MPDSTDEFMAIFVAEEDEIRPGVRILRVLVSRYMYK